MTTAVSNFPVNGRVSNFFSESQLTIDKKNVPDQPVSDLIDFLPFNNESQFDPVEARNLLRSQLLSMSADMRDEVITGLQQAAEHTDNKEIKNLLENQLPIVKQEAKDGVSIDRLLELLFAFLLLLGKLNVERNISGAKLAEVTTLHAKASGENGIDAAFSNLSGALVGGFMTAGVVAAGFLQFSKGTTHLQKNIETNVRDVNHNRQMTADLNNAIRRPVGSLSGNSPQERLKTLDTANGKVTIAPNQDDLNGNERSVLTRAVNQTQVTIENQDVVRRTNELAFSREQAGGQAIMSIGQHMAPIGQTGFGIQAASANAQAKVNDADAAVAATAQHSDEQAAQRSTENLAKVQAMISSVKDSDVRLLNDMIGNSRV